MNEKIKKIAVFVPNKPFFGAVLVQFPFFQHLRQDYPQAQIKLWSPIDTVKLLVKYQLADEYEVYDKKTSKWHILKSLNRYKADIAINFRDKSEIIALIFGLSNARLKVGIRSSYLPKLCFHKTYLNNLQIYRGLNYLQFLDILNQENRFGFEKLKALRHQSHLQLSEDRPHICLMPGGGEGEHKRWGIENFIHLCKLLQETQKNVHFIFVTGREEEPYLPIIQKELKSDDYTLVHNAPIEDIVKTVFNSQVTIANDCGPSHIAQMCEVNYVSLWGWENQQPYLRIMEWFLPRENSASVVAHLHKGIKTIAPKRVLGYVLPYL
ncbi:MAG: glycosyltransferase family 9 protein [Microscillaceae bacterium]|nr:glycosyltransferase family 9 protein [Microscillaceae bacterium]